MICGTMAVSIISLEEKTMDDFYTEQLIKKQTGMKDLMIRALLVALTIVSVFAIFMFSFGLLITVILIIVDVIMFRSMNVEYEYLFVNGDLDIDKIMNKSKRKRLLSVSLDQLEILAPVGAVELMQYKKAKTYDYTSGEGNADQYALIVSNGGEIKQIIFEPNDTIIEGFFMKAPRKVIRK